MSPVRSQPSSVNASRGLLGQVAVAEHHDFRAHQHLAVGVELDLHTRRRRSDGADPDPPGRIDAARPAGLAHAPQLRQRQPDRVEELQHFDGCGSGADVDRLDLVEPEHLTQAGEDLGVGSSDLLGQLRRHLLAPLLQAHLGDRRLQRRLHRRALLLGLTGEHRLQRRPSASPRCEGPRRTSWDGLRAGRRGPAWGPRSR